MPVSEFPLTSVSESMSASSTESQSLSYEASEWVHVSYASSFSPVTSLSEIVTNTPHTASLSEVGSPSSLHTSESALPKTGTVSSSNILATGVSILLSGLALLGIRKKDSK